MSAMGEVPDRDQIAADEARIGALLRAVEAPAPAGLTQAIVARSAPRRSRRVPAFALTFATACAAAAVALVLARGAGRAERRGRRPGRPRGADRRRAGDAHRHRHLDPLPQLVGIWAGRPRASVTTASAGGR